MAKSFEKHLFSIILTFVSITIGWLMTSSSDVVIAERGTTPTPHDMVITATILPSVTVRADDNMTSTALIVANTPDINAPESDTTTSTIQVTLTTTPTIAESATALLTTEPDRETRAPWEWSPRIGGGRGVGARDVGGYVYISTPGWRCNGALIDPEWVLTNAGCVTGNRTTGSPISTASIKVVTGCYRVVDCVKTRNPLWYGTQSQVVGVSRVLIYQPTPKVTDVDMTVALLKLSSPVITSTGVNVVPIGMSSDTVVGQRSFTVMSYGDIPPNKGPTILQRAVYSIASDSSCSGLKGYRDGMHHCGDTAPQVCKVDWGAPITRIINGQPVLYGILASQTAFYGKGCPKNERSVAIDVTSDSIRQWIATTIRQGRTGVIADQNGRGGLGNALARGNNRQHVIDIGGVFPQGIRIGGVTSKKLSINENGVIALGSMTSGIPSYIDIAKWRGGKAPVIVVFGADGDTSGTAQRGVIGGTSSGSNQVWVTQDVSRRVVVITWDDIRPMSTSVTGARAIGNSYQVELRAQENGDVKVMMRYGVIGWTAGATQCGANCHGKYAQVGIADGRGKFQLGVPVVATSDVGLRKLTGKQLTFYLRDGVINRVNQVPPVRPTWTSSPMPSITPTTTPLGYGLTDGLLAWYPLNGIRQIASTAPIQVGTTLGAAQSFDGVNDYHTVPIDLSNKSFTISLWAKHDPTNRSYMISAGRVISDYSVLHLGFRSTGQFICDFYEFNRLYVEYTPPPTFDKTQWHQYACSFDHTSKTKRLYIDGELVATQAMTSNFIGTSDFYMGVTYIAYSNFVHYFKGYMRDVMIYNRVLSTNEIRRIKNLTPNSVMTTLPLATNQCRWIDAGGMVHEYEINHDLLTWEQAKAVAESKRRGGQRGYLATITSVAEQDCIGQLIDLQMGWSEGNAGGGPWLGAKRLTSGGIFVWQSGPERGMQIKSSLGGLNIGYDNWSVENPSNYANVENALHIWAKQFGGVWNDNQESVTLKSLIEYTYPVAAQTATPSRSRTPTMTMARTLTPSPTVTPHSAGLQTGLLAWYPLDGIRATGSTLPIQVDSVFGKAQQFDGVDDYHKTTLDLANKTFSLAFWAQFDIELNQHSTVLHTGSVAGDNKAFACGYSYTLARVGCGIYGLNMGVHYDAPVGFNLGDWHHYAFSFDNSTKQMKLYVDGILVEAHTNPSSVLTSTSEFWIGRPNWGGAEWHFKGKVRDVLVYNRVLSSSEIQRIKQITPDRLMQTTPTVAQACRWVDAGGMVHEYEINHDLLTWEQAKAVAESKRRGGQRGYLATITSAAENECLVNFVDKSSGWVSGNTGFGPWLGAKRVSAAGRFIWQVGPEQGMQLKSTLTDAVIGYEYWNNDQPDNYAGVEDALHIYGRPNFDVYSWNDISSTAQLKSIIEYTYAATAAPLLKNSATRTPTVTPTRRMNP